MILNGRPRDLASFAASPRLHAVDPKGDTPLHIAAKMGNFALCDLFIRSGAQIWLRNLEKQTPADAASAEGHVLIARLLETLMGVAGTEELSPPPEAEAATKEKLDSPAPTPLLIDFDDLDDFLSFEADDDPLDYINRLGGKDVSGDFKPISTDVAIKELQDASWDLDLTSAAVSGDGFNVSRASQSEKVDQNDFLLVRKRGRQSTKQAVLSLTTRLAIEPSRCLECAADIITKSFFTSDDLDGLVAACVGDGDPMTLRENVRRTLESAGFEEADKNSESLDWGVMSDVSVEDLAQGLEACLSRRTPLPGTQRFHMDKAIEERLLGPMVRAKQVLKMGILGCEPVVRGIIAAATDVIDGTGDASAVTLRPAISGRSGDPDSLAFIKARDVLQIWHAGGCVMDGRRRREALEALERLELTLTVQKRIVGGLRLLGAQMLELSRLEGLISALEQAINELILANLPFARRFAARNVEDGEDPEDVFQTAFTGLQRATRRFDPERGDRFTIYSSFWMMQSLTRWRADEGSLIRIPVHRREKLPELDRCAERLEDRFSRQPTNAELAEELGWTETTVEMFTRIPRLVTEVVDEDDVEQIAESPQEQCINQGDMKRVIRECLAELPERQAAIIRMRFGIDGDDEMTLEEIGEIYRVTRERIRQIEAKAMRFLTHPVRKRHLHALLGG